MREFEVVQVTLADFECRFSILYEYEFKRLRLNTYIVLNIDSKAFDDTCAACDNNWVAKKRKIHTRRTLSSS